MKIGMIGTGGTGKTTLALALARELGVQYYPSNPRAVFKELNIVEDDQRSMTPVEKWEIQRVMFDRKLLTDMNAEEGIFDRTLIDHLSYCLCRCGEEIPETSFKNMLSMTDIVLKEYDLLLYFPNYGWKVEDDNLRSTNEVHLTHIELLMMGLVQLTGIRPVTVRDESVEARTAHVVELVRAGFAAKSSEERPQ